ncbi:MAG TPA: CoA transferase [Acidimicrobiales bacterium]|nr:CoA transferase [Acidimicrobiales bacterium]
MVVVDLSEGVAGPYCTKILADFGARVIKVEPPSGDWARGLGPYREDRADPEAGGMFLHLNTNKEGIVVDLESDEGAGLVRDLALKADVLVESFRPGRLRELGLGASDLLGSKPELVVTSVTPFGQTGPYRDFEMTEIVAFAMGGPMNASGVPEREPVKLLGNLVHMQAGNTACTATLGALYLALETGRGQAVDVAVFETQNGSTDRRRYYHLAHQYTGTVSRRAAVVGDARVAPGGRFVAGDGGLVTTGRIWPDHLARMVAVVGDPEVDSLFRRGGAGALAEAGEIANAAIARWVGARTARQAMREAQAGGWPVVVVNDPRSLLSDDHLEVRGFWVSADHPVAGPVVHAGPPWRIGGGGWELHRTAPLLGQDTDRVLAEVVGYGDERVARLRADGVVR